MLRPREEVLDERRNVRRRIARWTSNVFNRQFWPPFGGAQRPQQRQQVVLYPPEFEVEARPLEDVDGEDNEIDVGVRPATGFSTVFKTAAGTDIDHVNANPRPVAWLHQWIGSFFPRSLRNNQHRVVTASLDIYDIKFVDDTLGLHLRQSKGSTRVVVQGISSDNAHKDTIQIGDDVVAIGAVNVATLPVLTRCREVEQLIAQQERPLTIKFLSQRNETYIRRNRLLAAHTAARIHDENESADYSNGTRRLAELNARINNEISIPEYPNSGIDIVLGNIEPREDEIDSYHQIRVDHYRSPEHYLLLEKVEELLPSFHVPCMVYHRVEASRLLKPRSASSSTARMSTNAASASAAYLEWAQDAAYRRQNGMPYVAWADYYAKASSTARTSTNAASASAASSSTARTSTNTASASAASSSTARTSTNAASASAASSSTARTSTNTASASAASSSTARTSTNAASASAASSSTARTSTNAASASASSSSSPSPITGFPFPQSSIQSSTDPSDCCANLFDWSKMARDDWNTHLLLKEIISKNDIDVDSESIAAIKALNGPHLYYHICNNQPVTVIIVCSFAPFGLHEGSAFHKFMELFFYGVSYLVIDLCPIIAPGGVGILGRQNCSANILGLTIHNKIMTKLEGILRPIRDNNQAIIVGWGNASRSGNMGDIIGDYHAKHPCCIYAGHGNMDKDYDSVVSGAKLQMKLFGNTNQHKSEKYLWWIKWIIISNNRAFTRDSVNIGKKIEQSIAWNRVGMYIDYNFKAEKMPTKFWYDDEIEKLLQFCIAEMFANEVNGKKNIDWSLWENFSGSYFTRTDAQKKISKMIINNYGTNKPRTRELFESLLDKITQL